MTNRQKQVLLLLLLAAALCLSLTACGGGPAAPAVEPLHFAAGDADPEAESLTMALAAGETALLEQLPGLRFADLSGSEDPAEIAAWAAAHPEVRVRFTVTLPDGTEVDSDAERCDLSALSGAEAEAAAERLRLLSGLKSLKLGAARPGMDWDSIGRIREALPGVELRYSFPLYGKDCDLANTSLNLSHIPVDDGGAALRQAMAFMDRLSYLDMDSCGLSNAEMEELRRDFPEVRIVWRVWFGENYSVRTDVQRILASKPSVGGMLNDGNVEGLYHCHDVVFLDIGHNQALTDISFVAEMPKLEAAILAMCGWTDATPLAACPELEYLEMQSTPCGDLTPFAGMKNLRHLNIANNLAITDISPLYALTELERLWIGSMTRVSNEQVEEMRRRAPDCEIDTAVYADPTAGRWRWDEEGNLVPRYYLLRLQFDDYKTSSYSYSWNDPLY